MHCPHRLVRFVQAGSHICLKITLLVTKHISDLFLQLKKKKLTNIFYILKKWLKKTEIAKTALALTLAECIIGKAREIYTQLTIEHSSNCDTVTELILKAYRLVGT